MRISRKVINAFVLALYIGFTIGIYAIVCHFTNRPFQDLHLLYAALIGCIAYLPRFISEKKKNRRQ